MWRTRVATSQRNSRGRCWAGSWISPNAWKLSPRASCAVSNCQSLPPAVMETGRVGIPKSATLIVVGATSTPSALFTPDEMKRVQRHADTSTADVGDLVAFLFGTGARISEALRNTAWVDVDLEAQTVRVRGTKTRHADRVLALGDGLTERIRNRALRYGTDGQVFGTTRFAVNRNGTNVLGKPRDRQNVLKAIRRVLTAAGTQWAGSHSFRRTVATWMDEAGAPLAEIDAQLGHGDLNVTARYLGRTTAPTRAASIMILDYPDPSSEDGE